MKPEDSPPTREQVDDMLAGLADGRISREQAANWAGRWVRMPTPNVEDQKIWRALVQLSGADLITTDRPFLHGAEDFAAWLEEFRRL